MVITRQIEASVSLSLHKIGGFPTGQPYDVKVAIATGLHLFPFRTEKLNPFAPMVLLYQVGE